MFDGKYKKNIKKHLQSNNLLYKKIAEGLEQQGLVEVLAVIYQELYLLKKQLMGSGVIEPEASYLLAEIYEEFEKQDREQNNTNSKLN